MPSKKLLSYLDENNIRYVTIKHSQAFTAQEIAASAKISGRDFAKTVVVKVNGKICFAVLPGSYKIDFEELKKVLDKETVRLAYEQEFMNKFPDCEVGAMPPFGNLYDVDVYVAESLTKDESIAFNACTHTELIQMKYKDFAKLVKPKVIKFSKSLV
jgi:Ala-tRNA(Pro) deacylase